MPTKNSQSIFKGTAWYYAKYRRGYPNSFFEHITKSFSLDKNSRVLDLGCGTGQIAIPISRKTREVVALDVNQEMLDEGKTQAKNNKIDNIVWVNSKAENISKKLGSFKMTTMGASFHWMEQDRVLAKVYDITEEGGGVTIVSNPSSIHRNKNNDPRKDVVLSVIEKHLGKKRRAGKSLYKKPKGKFENALMRSGFSRFQTFTDSYTQSWDIDSIISFLYSTSFANKQLLGDKLEAFENDIKKSLLELNNSSKFKENVVVEALLAWK